LNPAVIIDSTDVHALAMRALDTAKAAGAHYADVRLTRQLDQHFEDAGEASTGVLMKRSSFWGRRGSFWGESETFGLGVRVLVDGFWGFAASPYWQADEAVRLARVAVAQAGANAHGQFHRIDWAPIPVANGSWATPISVDPFLLPLEEKMDLMTFWRSLAAERYRKFSGGYEANFLRKECAVATTDGAYFTQTLYESSGKFGFGRETIYGQQKFGHTSVSGVDRTAAGWELFTEADIPSQIPNLYEQADPNISELPVKPGDIGRYDVVFDAQSLGALMEKTIGTATQLDRALGYEANAGGTSYLGPHPLALLGTYEVGSSLLKVTANRSMHRGVGTVKWDDEGVVPEDFTLVDHGVLVDYQTMREQAPLLAPYYQKIGTPVRSHGCAAADSALSITMQHTPNLVLEPQSNGGSFDDLVKDTKKGLAVMEAGIQTDFQQRNGFGQGQLREIVNGKLGSVVAGLGFLFNTTELWNNLVALGGPGTAVQYASDDRKGEPSQSTPHSVRSVPGKVTNVTFINPRRKA
jgi:TldD protein